MWIFNSMSVLLNFIDDDIGGDVIFLKLVSVVRVPVVIDLVKKRTGFDHVVYEKQTQ